MQLFGKTRPPSHLTASWELIPIRSLTYLFSAYCILAPVVSTGGIA